MQFEGRVNVFWYACILIPGSVPPEHSLVAVGHSGEISSSAPNLLKVRVETEPQLADAMVMFSEAGMAVGLVQSKNKLSVNS